MKPGEKEPSRWEVLKKAFEVIAAKADQTSAQLEFRLFKSKTKVEVKTTRGTTKKKSSSTKTTCELDEQEPSLSLLHAQSMSTGTWDDQADGQYTPMSSAILQGVKYLSGDKSGPKCSPKVLVLITDGKPDCPKPRGEKPEEAATLNALAEAARQVSVVVIGAGDPKDLEKFVGKVCAVVSAEQAASLTSIPSCIYIKDTANAPQLVNALLATTCIATRDGCDGCDNDCDGSVDEDCFQADFAQDPLADVAAVGDSQGWHCSGVLVSPRHVLTARHCLPATRVLFGSDIESPEEILDVRRSIPHPDAQLDAALLELKTLTERPIRRRRQHQESHPPLGIVRHAGFGARDEAGKEGFGHKHYMDVWANGWNCGDTESRRLGCHPEFEFSLPAGGGRDTCSGDSGGPVLERIDRAPLCAMEISQPVYRILGITSRPVATSRQRCGDGGIYVRMDSLAAWLDVVLPSVTQEKP